MIGWYIRRGGVEELLWVPHNFYIYTCGFTTCFCYDPDVLEDIDSALSNPRNRRINNRRLENSNWEAEKIEIPDFQIRAFHDFCTANADDREIFNSMMQIFHDVVCKLDYVSRDRRKVI